MPTADAYLDFRMRAHHARRRARLLRDGPLFDVLVRVHEQEAARWQQMADEELAAMEAEATKVGKPVSFSLGQGWAIVVEPANPA